MSESKRQRVTVIDKQLPTWEAFIEKIDGNPSVQELVDSRKKQIEDHINERNRLMRHFQ